MVLSVEESAAEKLVSVLPRVLIVSRRTVRKNKFVDFVGEYHLDLIVQYGAVPVIVPRVTGVHTLLDSFEPIHGVLLCEGEDIDPSLYDNDLHNLTQEEIEEIKRLHISDTSIDKNKDSIELQLAKRCLERNIPYLGICRGSQVLNVACGGSLFQDVEKELLQKGGLNQVEHINYEDYDGHRHAVEVLKGTPLHEWFKDSFISGEETCQLNVNSYHHQGVKRLAERFRAMAYAPDGLIEAFYDPENFDPSNGKFIIGLQFHPERMQHEKDTDISTGIDLDSVFDYPGCPRAYQDFVKAVISYQKRLSLAERGKEVAKLDVPLEKQRRKIVRSFSLAKCLYEEQVHSRKSRTEHNGKHALKALQTPQVFGDENDLEVGAEFLLMSTTSNTQQERRLKQMGATVRNSLLVSDKMQAAKKREAKARALLGKLPTEELHDLLEFYESMAQAASYLLQRRNLTNADI